jgi:DNA-binding CsgD family transcriptional regulator
MTVARAKTSASVELLVRALDALDFGVLVMSSDFDRLLHSNHLGRDAIGGTTIPPALLSSIDEYCAARAATHKDPPAMKLTLGERCFYLRLSRCPGRPPVEVVTLREEVLRDAALFQLLNSRHQVSRREYQVLCGLRVGQTNRQLATSLGIAEGTVARHVHRLLRRFDVANRTGLANLVEQLAQRRR